MIETDYVWMKPLQAPPADDKSATPMGFPFGYITPQAPQIEGVMRKMYPVEKGPLSDVPESGPAPALMRVHEWIKVLLKLSLSRYTCCDIVPCCFLILLRSWLRQQLTEIVFSPECSLPALKHRRGD